MAKRFTVAVLSGKGGTGKTFIAVNLAAVATGAAYVDCDVEEPNGHLFFKPEGIGETIISNLIPVVNPALCNGCRACINFCRFNALAFIQNKVKVFENICHSCGGCVLFCRQKAMAEKEVPVGVIRKGNSGQVQVHTGIMNLGESSGVPVIRALRKADFGNAKTVVVDCPPGSACTVMESIQDADYCVLVAEPTVFGTQNLAMVHQLAQLFHKPCGVVLNKCAGQYNPAEEYCREHGIFILEKIPFETKLAAMNANAKIAVREDKAWEKVFSRLLATIQEVSPV